MHSRYYLSNALMMVCLWTVSAFAQSAPCVTQSCCETTNLGQQKTALLAYEASGQYDHDIKAVVDQAKMYLAQQAGRKGKLAIVLDIDETALSNWPEMKANDFGFFVNGPCDLSPDGTVQAPCGWNKWVDLGKDLPIAPTLDLYGQARSQGLKCFFITGRREAQRASTTANLRAAGYDGWQDKDLIMKPNDLRPPSAAYFKTEARKRIVDQGYIIVLSIGDQDSDLTGGYAERTFKLPNPFYYLP
jgi:acid phosphatase